MANEAWHRCWFAPVAATQLTGHRLRMIQVVAALMTGRCLCPSECTAGSIRDLTLVIVLSYEYMHLSRGPIYVKHAIRLEVRPTDAKAALSLPTDTVGTQAV